MQESLDPNNPYGVEKQYVGKVNHDDLQNCKAEKKVPKQDRPPPHAPLPEQTSLDVS